MKALVRYLGNMTFVGRADSNHWVVMDTSEKVGGEEAAVKPIELVLIGLGGCTGIDVVSILKKMKVKFDKFEVHTEAQQSEDFPKIFTKIHIEYIFYGKDIKEQSIERAIKLSEEKYCSVSAMLKKSAEVTYSYKVM